jgi:protein-(glutamine-N5) methyltransferase, release factor-specific
MLKKIITHLLPLYADQEIATANAWWILESITKKSKTTLLLTRYTLTKHEKAQLQEWLHALLIKQMPLQYLVGEIPFLNLILTVRPPILIPRPETEAWCAHLIEQLHTIPPNFTILDMCTGSGCIGLALAQALAHAHVTALDIDPRACTLAQENALKNSIKNYKIIESDLFSALPKAAKFDLIVANPPYISFEVWQTLENHVKLWEAQHALAAHDQGLALIRAIISGAHKHLKQNARLAIEIGYDQGIVVKNIMREHGFHQVQIQQDLSGHDRVVTGTL